MHEKYSIHISRSNLTFVSVDEGRGEEGGSKVRDTE